MANQESRSTGRIRAFISDPPWWVWGLIAVHICLSFGAQAVGGFPAPWYELAIMAAALPFFAWISYREWKADVDRAKEAQDG